MDAHEWKIESGAAFRLAGRQMEYLLPGAVEWRELKVQADACDEILRLAEENAELRAIKEEATAHALGLSNEISALHEGERQRQIEMLCSLIDRTRGLERKSMNELVRAKLAELRKEGDRC